MVGLLIYLLTDLSAAQLLFWGNYYRSYRYSPPCQQCSIMSLILLIGAVCRMRPVYLVHTSTCPLIDLQPSFRP